MTEKQKKEVAILQENVRTYEPIVRQKLASSGIQVPDAAVHSLAKYYPALKSLADE